jgi:hypothetical protein
MATQDAGIWTIGFLPFLTILAAAAITLVFLVVLFLLSRLTLLEVGGLGGAIGLIVGMSLLVLVFVNVACAAVRPREMFQDVSSASPLQDLITNIVMTETDVCRYITEADNFIKNKVGKPGQDNPQLVSAAQKAARQMLVNPLIKEYEPIPMSTCPSVWPKDISGADAVFAEADNRIAKMESTLKLFTLPQFTEAKAAMACTESFADAAAAETEDPRLTALKQRLAAVQATIASQKSEYLDPIHQKQADLQKGIASDCEKRKGAKSAVAASNVTPPTGHKSG